MVTSEGREIGKVDALLIDRQTHQLRYVVLSHDENDASIAIPWQTLYFDSSLVQLVFYTYS